jgi:hypothetical protein
MKQLFHREKEETRKKKKGNKLLFALFVSCVCRPKRIKNGRGVLEWDGHSSSYRRRQVVIRRTKNQEGKNGHTTFSSTRAAGQRKNHLNKNRREDTGVSNVIPPLQSIELDRKSFEKKRRRS